METRWAKEVSQTQPLPEYPRPQLQRGEESWGSLNGPWDYAVLPAEQDDSPQRWEGTILVPFAIESRLSGVQRTVGKEQRLWYRRTFATPALGREQRLRLHFGAVDWHAIVWLNGQKVGEHKGGYDPFTFDVTDALAAGQEQTLVVSAWDPTDEGTQPRGKQHVQPSGIWYTAVTGIWQTVWWEIVPASHVERLTITPDVDRKQVTVAVTVTGPTEGLTAAVRLLEDGREVASTESREPGRAPARLGATTYQRQRGARSRELILDVPRPRLWSPDSPFLYDLEITLRRDGRDVDRVTSYCGLRKISLRKDAWGVDRIALNDEILFQCGPLDQGWWPDGLYTAPTDEALRFDLEITRKLGFNATRKHVKVEPERWYHWADRLGLLVWQDMPSAGPTFTPVGGPEGRAGPEAAAQFRTELRAMLDTLRNHPSIVVWVPFNEGWGQHDTNATLRWVKEHDPTRLVDGPSGWTDMGFGDLIDVHRYPGPGMHPPVEGRASVLAEFGGVGRAVEGHLWSPDKNWGYLSTQSLEELQAVYDDLIDELPAYLRNGLAAAIYTQLTDVENEVNGLLTYDREVVKFDAGKLAERHRALYAPVRSLRERMLLPTGEREPKRWQYRSEEPAEGWTAVEFDDARWETGTAPFGRPGTQLFPVSTLWTGAPIWLRRAFTLTQAEVGAVENLHLRLQNSENAIIYLNGVEVRREKGFSPTYRLSPLGEAGKRALRAGANLLAVHCEGRREGAGDRLQILDVGLVEMRE